RTGTPHLDRQSGGLAIRHRPVVWLAPVVLRQWNNPEKRIALKIHRRIDRMQPVLAGHLSQHRLMNEIHLLIATAVRLPFPEYWHRAKAVFGIGVHANKR